jgi:hypothetical protein
MAGLAGRLATEASNRAWSGAMSASRRSLNKHRADALLGEST